MLKALRTVWHSTRVQRCLFHVCMNITLRAASRGGQEPEEGRHRPCRVSRTPIPRRNGWRRTTSGNTTRSSSTRKATGRTAPSPTSTGVSPKRAGYPQTHPRGAPVHVRRTAGGVRDADPVDEQPHRVMERMHPRHAAPAPGPVPGAGRSRRCADGAISTPGIRNPTRGSRPTPSRKDKSRRSTGKPGNTARWAHDRRPESRCDTAPASTGTNSTPQPNTTAPPTDPPPDTHFGL